MNLLVKKSVKITRAGVYLKPVLVQVAHAAVKTDKSPYYKQKEKAIKQGKKLLICEGIISESQLAS